MLQKRNLCSFTLNNLNFSMICGMFVHVALILLKPQFGVSWVMVEMLKCCQFGKDIHLTYLQFSKPFLVVNLLSGKTSNVVDSIGNILFSKIRIRPEISM